MYLIRRIFKNIYESLMYCIIGIFKMFSVKNEEGKLKDVFSASIFVFLTQVFLTFLIYNNGYISVFTIVLVCIILCLTIINLIIDYNINSSRYYNNFKIPSLIVGMISLILLSSFSKENKVINEDVYTARVLDITCSNQNVTNSRNGAIESVEKCIIELKKDNNEFTIVKNFYDINYTIKDGNVILKIEK